MNKAPEKAKAKEEVKTPSKIRLHVRGDMSTIFRNDGLPFIEDKTDSAVKWLADNDFKSTEIEIIGEKPAIWNSVYPPAVPVA